MKQATKSGGKSKPRAASKSGTKTTKAKSGSRTQSRAASRTRPSSGSRAKVQKATAGGGKVQKETTGGSLITSDHEEIRTWAEERGGKPACVRRTGGKGDLGILRIDFPGYSGPESLEEITWDEWFEKFDERQLALLHQEETAGGQKSNFNKIISRETAETARKPKTKRAGGS